MRAPHAAALGLLVALSAPLGSACKGGPGDATGPLGPATAPPVPPAPVKTTLSAAQQKELADIEAKLAAVRSLDAAGFAAKYRVPFATELGYDPLKATGLDTIQASPLALDDKDRAVLATHGFVVTTKVPIPTFVEGYYQIYKNDLPVYVSVDSILEGIQSSFELMLQRVEENSLSTVVVTMLDAMRASLASGAGADLSPDAVRDADTYLAVARSLIGGALVAPVAGADASAVSALFALATAGSGASRVSLFGVDREEDFSQYLPRGHYANTPLAKQYFRAMMWLGRTDLRLVETQPDGSQVFRRRQLEGAYVLRAAMNDAAVGAWKTLDTTIGAFVGEADSMTVPELDRLLADLGVPNAAGLSGLGDEAIAQAIVGGGYGAQRIASHLMTHGIGAGTLPLSSSFCLFGQRYVLDSEVFSNVVFDRVNRDPFPKRMMPNPLDVAFAAMESDQAGTLLGPEVSRYGYAPDLASMRVLADAHPSDYWDENLYNGWLGALRSLSPGPEVADPGSGLPRVARTEPWGRRLLSAQLASWTGLRHATVLYAKQSYTTGAACEYPDAYVDPYPEFYARIAAYAARGATLIGGLGLIVDAPKSVGQYFADLQSTASRLESMAKAERTGAPHSADDLAFINHLVFTLGCADMSFDGWYAKLFLDPTDATKATPLIADVHTQPTDEAGNPVGRVLHVATGRPRLMVVTTDGCSGPRAYVGPVFSYYERVTEEYKRLTDAEWADTLRATPPAAVPWTADLVSPPP